MVKRATRLFEAPEHQSLQTAVVQSGNRWDDTLETLGVTTGRELTRGGAKFVIQGPVHANQNQ